MAATDDLERNAMLAKLPKRELRRLREGAEIVAARPRDQVYRPDEPITAVYFPLSCIYSVVAVADGRIAVEVATVGHEGMVGLPIFLGAHTSPHAAFCQVPGEALEVSAADLRAVLSDDGALHRVLNRFTQATMVQVAQNVVCNSTHPADQRAARWLLTTHDRVGRDQFELTQEFLAQMLGLRRPTVSEVARRLQSSGLIDYRRGLMQVLDRPGLEAATCQCYFTVRAEFDAITGRG